MKKREVLGTVKFDTAHAMADRGHEWGKGRAPRVHKHKTVKREKQRLKRELREW